MLYFKGYQAVQVYRIAHELWHGERNERKDGKHAFETAAADDDDDDGEEGGGSRTKKSGVRASRVMARMLQSRVSEVFAVDIHPAAKLGRGLLLDHGTGVVIGVSYLFFSSEFCFLFLFGGKKRTKKRARLTFPSFLSFQTHYVNKKNKTKLNRRPPSSETTSRSSRTSPWGALARTPATATPRSRTTS